MAQGIQAGDTKSDYDAGMEGRTHYDETQKSVGRDNIAAQFDRVSYSLDELMEMLNKLDEAIAPVLGPNNTIHADKITAGLINGPMERSDVYNLIAGIEERVKAATSRLRITVGRVEL